MLKKLISMLLIVMMAVTMVSFCAQGEDYGGVHPESLVFDSEWVSEEAWAQVTCEDGGFKVMILKNEAWPGGYCWECSCLYDEKTHTLISTGFDTKSRITYAEDGNGAFDFGETEYEDGVSTFEINEAGQLIWHDEKENAGEGIAFTKIGWFNNTTWACDRASIEIAWQDEGYKVFVQWGSSAWETTEWDYSCAYDPETGVLTDHGLGTMSNLVYDDEGYVTSWTDVYTDGEAAFFLNENGNLIWKDAKENAGEGMEFVRVWNDEM